MGGDGACVMAHKTIKVLFPMNDVYEQARTQFTRCFRRPRYRVAWLVGPPQSNKTLIASRLCHELGWHYLNYTLQPGYFDSLTDQIETYQYIQFCADIAQWSRQSPASVLVLDEIDSLLAYWSVEQRSLWASAISRSTSLELDRGVLLVSHFFDHFSLQRYLPDQDLGYCLDLGGASL